MTDTDALHERIARALYESEVSDDWTIELDEYKEPYLDFAAAVLLIVAEEVRKAKAEAWDEGWKERSRRDIYRSGPLDDARPVPGPPRSLNPHRATETGDQA